MKQARSYPRLTITRKAAKSLQAGHPWVYADEVIDAEPTENGAVVDLFEENGTWQGAALVSQRSTIRARVVTSNANDHVDAAFWRRRIEWAWRHRVTSMGGRGIAGAEPDTTCCRVLFSEADGVPGLVVDKYEDVLVTQVGTVGMERLRPVVYQLLLDVLRGDGQEVRAIYERNDGSVRAKEGLDRYQGWWDGTAAADERLVVRENGVRFRLDLANSQKTGFFLDQKYNRRAVRELAAGRRVLDCFCHVGPFGLNALAGGASYVRFVDASQTALDLVGENAALNGFGETPGTWGTTKADVLTYLPELRNKRRLRDEGGPFDLIVLDPPAFTKSGRTVRNAARGYRELNAAALRILPRGGYLATCSCSQHMTRDLLAQAIAEAAHGTNRQLKQVEERQQAPDHPILWGFPQSHYLDFFVFQVV
ncbi:MAG: class I SAM-dependent rRNA methyltransferase [Atopobiaceae bacterium]|nr:class I SAM-dependent rRNA methyltransferase [Atopobiaceae bacterium]